MVQLDNANDGAMFAAAVQTARVIANMMGGSDHKKREKPRKIPGLAKSEQRGFIVSDRALVNGNLCARDMLGDLRYWLEPDETGKCRATKQVDGHYWVARSIQFWMQQLGYSKQEVRTGIEYLVKSGAVHREQKEFGNWDTDHYRLNFDVAGYKLYGEAKCVASNTVCVGSNTATSGSTQEVSKDKKPKTKIAQAQKAPAGQTNPDPLPPCVPAGQSTPDSPVGNTSSFPTTPAGWDGEDMSEQPKAGYTFRGMVANMKRQWIEAAGPKITATLNEAESKTVDMLEFRLYGSGIKPLSFMGWLTPSKWQRLCMAFGEDPNFNVLFLAKAHVFRYMTAVYLECEASGMQGFQEIAERIAEEHRHAA